MIVITPNSPLFNYDECKSLYEKNQKFLEEDLPFDELLVGIDFYSFFEGAKHLGCIYYYPLEGRLYVNAFANRHTHKLNLECFKRTLNFYDCDIYARSSKKTAILCLLKCGFKKIDKNLYKYERSI